MSHQRHIVVMVVLAASLLTTNALPTEGQRVAEGVMRIRFKRGESSATVSGQLGRKVSQYFLISARAGQQLFVQVKGRNDSSSSPFLIYIDNPAGKSVSAGTNDDAIRIRLKQTGNYLIKVGLPHFLEGSMQQFSILVRVD